MKGHMNKISKRNQKRHFSHELWGGKGDHRRKFDAEGEQAYRDNYDRIFGKKKEES